MDDVQKKVLLDIFAAPISLLPVVGGLTSLLLGWGFSSSILLAAGAIAVLGGIGILGTRLVFGLESLTNKACEHLHNQKTQERQDRLDELESNLTKDRDPRTQRLLRDLRSIHETFVADVESGKIAKATREVVDIVDGLFQACVANLEQSYAIYRSDRRKKRKNEERDAIVEEVADTVDRLRDTVKQFRALEKKKKKKDVNRLMGDLDKALEVARATEDRMASWEDDGESRHAEFELE